MYEREVNTHKEPIESIPPEIRKRFRELKNSVQARTLLPWSEHCTECVWPTCYTTCQLYTPRKDGACRLFIDGMVRVDHEEGLNPYLLKIKFKPWGKLLSVGSINLYSAAKANAIEQWNGVIGGIAQGLPLPKTVRTLVIRKIRYVKNQWAKRTMPQSRIPDYFLLECYNPADKTIELTFTIRCQGRSRTFQRLLAMAPGFNREKIEFTEISPVMPSNKSFELEIMPGNAGEAALYFGFMDFVKENGTRATAEKKIKCIVWDLDNTLWNGVLIEDGREKIQIKERVIEIIRETDRRGILHSIASKNNAEDALAVLEEHGIEDYFLYPQIGWQPKSQAITQIASHSASAPTRCFLWTTRPSNGKRSRLPGPR